MDNCAICAICMEVLGERGEPLNCGHLYHAKCVIPWLQKNRSCPTCRDKPRSDNTNELGSDDEVTPEEGRRRYYLLRTQMTELATEFQELAAAQATLRRDITRNAAGRALGE